jgi:hypothetical protein
MDPQQQASAEMNFPTVGRWQVTALPSGWIYVAQFGIRQMPKDANSIIANVSLGQDELPESDDLATYIAGQSKLIANHLTDSARAGPQPMTFPGADEASLFFVRHTPTNSPKMLHAQTYARQGRWVGIITLTTRESELQVVRADYEAFVKGLRIIPA